MFSELAMVVHLYNSGTQGAEAGESLWLSGLPELQGELLSQRESYINKKKKNMICREEYLENVNNFQIYYQFNANLKTISVYFIKF